MEIITKESFIKKLEEINNGDESHKLHTIRYMFSFLKSCGFDLFEAKKLFDVNYDTNNFEKLYVACEKYILEVNSFSEKGLVVVQNETSIRYKCEDNPYKDQGTGEFPEHACVCLRDKSNCKKYPVAIINHLITRKEITKVENTK